MSDKRVSQVQAPLISSLPQAHRSQVKALILLLLLSLPSYFSTSSRILFFFLYIFYFSSSSSPTSSSCHSFPFLLSTLLPLFILHSYSSLLCIPCYSNFHLSHPHVFPKLPSASSFCLACTLLSNCFFLFSTSFLHPLPPSPTPSFFLFFFTLLLFLFIFLIFFSFFRLVLFIIYSLVDLSIFFFLIYFSYFYFSFS